MLCPSVFQLSPVTISPVLYLHWPIRSLWPETRPLFSHMEQEMMHHLQEVRQSIKHKERLHQKIFEELEHASPSSSHRGVFMPICFQDLSRDGGGFALSLDTEEFSPEELSVRQVGRRLRVSGRMEKKQEDGQGFFSYRCQEFRQELDLPEGVDSDSVTCSLLGGRLQIQALREKPLSDGKERVVPITLSSAPAITSPPSDAEVPQEDGSSAGKGAVEQN